MWGLWWNYKYIFLQIQEKLVFQFDKVNMYSGWCISCFTEISLFIYYERIYRREDNCNIYRLTAETLALVVSPDVDSHHSSPCSWWILDQPHALQDTIHKVPFVYCHLRIKVVIRKSLGFYMYRVYSIHWRLCCKSQVNWKLFLLILEGSELKVIQQFADFLQPTHILVSHFFLNEQHCQVRIICWYYGLLALFVIVYSGIYQEKHKENIMFIF